MNNGLLGIFSYIILFIYTVFTIGNLYMILQKKNTERNFFNIFLMPLLALFYLLRFKNHDILIYLAIFFFWIGDILFTRRNKKNIILGLPLFIIGIAFYIIKLATFIKIPNLNYLLTILIMVLYFGLVFFEIIISYEYASEYFKKDIIFLFAFAFLNATLCIMAILTAISTYKIGVWYLIFGSNLFLISNSLFLFATVIKNNRFFNICTTLTYTIATYLLITGFGLILI
ncbi:MULTISPECIES: lysoplasmalogenase family protein [unclassified Parvimonas]|uniref:lysoplasmalogenase family protein n=1 Tax=unclassified Parvimonas TaxID=1151464 RepID=UPI002B4AA880|nr:MULTISPECIES: lysoplasmalogenase family protein [unclassified Parvimonas]MEB3025631.1 lysoplasmalogenase family protein [Parvimonas sp. M13]MEB3089767.1 lysoplasmalogenase family protein [Parvimonas sp. M20]